MDDMPWLGRLTYGRKWLLLTGVLLLLIRAFPVNAQPLSISLTDDEKRWLEGHRTLALGVGVAFPPFMWVEKKDGRYEFKGMVSDYVDIVGERLGIDMEIVLGIPFDDALEQGRSGRIDLFPCLSQTPERSQFLLFTEPYLSFPLVIIMREGAPIVGRVQDLNGKRLAVVRHLVVYSKMENDYSDLGIDYVFTKTVDENLEAVSLGRADACIINLAVATYYIQKKGLTNLRVAAPVNWEDVQFSMGVLKKHPVLQGILTKALASISQGEKDRISQRWIRVKYEPGVDTGLIWRWGLGVGSGTAFLFFVIIAWNRRLQREIAGRIKAEKEREKTIAELRTALQEVKTLQGLVPICAYCKKIRDDEGYWKQIEEYLQERSDFHFSHGICPECAKKLYPDLDL